MRVIFCEIGRILSHLLNVTTQALDVGALTPSLWGFEERETLMTFTKEHLDQDCMQIILEQAGSIKMFHKDF